MQGSPRWLWPNLLSLDAPLVAALWQVLFARCFHVPWDPAATLLLLLTVWLIYSADRTLDAWRGPERSPRHEFHRRHWRTLLPLWIAVFALAGWMALARLSPGMFVRGALLLAAVSAYFLVVHGARRHWPKEAAVGALFALGASLVAWGEVRTLADAATIVLFFGLCWMNCVAIQKWEGDRLDWPAGAVALGVACAAALLLYADRPVLGGAELASALAFVALDRARRRLSADAVRVLADVALLSPLAFLPLVR